MSISMTGAIIAIIGGLIAILATFGKIVFDYATLKAQLSNITIICTKIELMLSDHANKFLTHETRMQIFENRLTILETKHNANHKEE